ncbi:pyridoxamine 5'-phosphate oxidase family protein [Propionibacteriaceae bacterium Y1700]|uniref:pyridoxamine 5'-phosphate oxidase family protein n=1 Tax=Microlunatus sp. Y1700 TaxID=3418487 RepID=UPI003DA6ED61
MAQQYPALTDRHRRFIDQQQLYFVATAAREGRVNVSPKGLDSLRVLSDTKVVWLNGTGSGNETAAHLLDTPRMTIMFCSFAREPLILRLYGDARAVHADDPEWDELITVFPPMLGARNIFVLDIDLVQTSCGYGVPTMDFTGQREMMHTWASKKGEEGLAAYHQAKNRTSIDGFPTGLPDPLS